MQTFNVTMAKGDESKLISLDGVSVVELIGNNPQAVDVYIFFFERSTTNAPPTTAAGVKTIKPLMAQAGNGFKYSFNGTLNCNGLMIGIGKAANYLADGSFVSVDADGGVDMTIVLSPKAVNDYDPTGANVALATGSQSVAAWAYDNSNVETIRLQEVYVAVSQVVPAREWLQFHLTRAAVVATGAVPLLSIPLFANDDPALVDAATFTVLTSLLLRYGPKGFKPYLGVDAAAASSRWGLTIAVSTTAGTYTGSEEASTISCYTVY